MSIEDTLLTIIFVPLMFVFVAWLIWIIQDWLKMRHKSQLQNKILEKFTTVQEFNDFIQSEEGHKFLTFLSDNGPNPREKILSSLLKGVIITFGGLALMVIGQIFTEEMKYFLAIGIVLIALGLGFLGATFISYTLSKKWGIIDGDK